MELSERAVFYSGKLGESHMNVLGRCSCGMMLLILVNQAFPRRSVTQLVVYSVLLFVMTLTYTNAYLLMFFLIKPSRKHSVSKRSSAFSLFRVTVLLMTVQSIVFVDFPQYPSGCAKTSPYLTRIGSHYLWVGGDNLKTSVMDFGASLFVVLNGFAPIEFKKTLKSSAINGMFWLVRYLATTTVNYYTPELEYGYKCNFFGYMSIIQLVGALTWIKHPSVLFIVLRLMFNVPIFGYLSLYFTAHSIRGIIYKSEPYDCLIGAIPFILADMNLISPSRMSSDLGFNLMAIGIAVESQWIGNYANIPVEDFSEMIGLIDRHSLLFFLIANVITGTANMVSDLNKGSIVECFLVVNSVMVISYKVLQWASTYSSSQ